MKKLLAIILTFAVLISSLSLTACNVIAPSSHSFSNEWTYDETHHWKACEDEDCEEVTQKATHSFIDGVCECGAKKDSSTVGGGGTTGGNGTTGDNSGGGSGSGSGNGSSSTGGGSTSQNNPQISESNWQKAFAFDNVTLRQYVVKEGKREYDGSFLFDGDKMMLSAPNHESITDKKDIIERTKSVYDFSSCFSNASYKDGKYFIESFSPVEGVEHKDVYLTFSDGKLISIEGTFVEGSDDDQPQGYYVELYNYGTTVVEKSSGTTGGNTSGPSGTNPIHPDYGGNQSTQDPTHPDLNEPDDPDPSDPDLDRVYLDDEERVYHRKINCVNKKLTPGDKKTAESKNYKECPICG